MSFAEDFTAFFDTDEFAVSATLNAVSVVGIFAKAYQATYPGGAGLGSSAPSFTLKTSDVPASPVGKSLVYSATTYTVAEHHPDGTGVSVLLLEVA